MLKGWAGKITSLLVPLALAGLGLLLLGLLNHRLLEGLGLDLTEERLHTLSPDTTRLLQEFQEPLQLTLYYSYHAGGQIPALRAYGHRVEEMLHAYQRQARGQLELRRLDPEPLSAAEEEAVRLGLEGLPMEDGSLFYLGLAALDSQGAEQTLPFFQPNRESFLEYDINRFLNRLLHPQPKVVGLISGLMLGGDPYHSPAQGSSTVLMEQMRQFFEVRELEMDSGRIPSEVDVLMVVHPYDLEARTLYAIDQFVLGGGRLALFLDPHAEMSFPGGYSSSLEPLLASWGVQMDAGKVLLDEGYALQVRSGPKLIRHLGLLGLRNLEQEDLTTAALETLNFSSSGTLMPTSEARGEFMPLVRSGPRSMLVESSRFEFLVDPSGLAGEFAADGQERVVAARIRGPASTAFPDGPPPPPETEEPAAEEPHLHSHSPSEEGALSEESGPAEVQEELAASEAETAQSASQDAGTDEMALNAAGDLEVVSGPLSASEEGNAGEEGIAGLGLTGAAAGSDGPPPPVMPETAAGSPAVESGSDAAGPGPAGESPAAEPEPETEPEAEKEPLPHLSSSDNIEMLVVADTDLLSDRLWVDVRELLGRRLINPWADNGFFVLNALESLAGGSSLAGIRSRGRFDRPFTRVEALRREAESRFRESERDLSEQLEATEQRLMELSTDQPGEGLLSINPEQRQALEEFQQRRLGIRAELRRVRQQLNRDIDRLGMQLKLLNILLMPTLLALLALWLGWRRHRVWRRTLAGPSGSA